MRWAVRPFAAFAACALVAGGTAREAPADGAAAEDAFLDGRFADVRALDSPDDDVTYPKYLLESWWRPAGVRGSGRTDSLVHRRYGWLGGADYPLPGAGEVDPHPRLTALVLDRIRRESQGARGLPDESPLASLKDDRVHWFVERIMRPAFLGPAVADRTPDERDHRRRVRDAAARNLGFAAISLVVLLLAAGAAIWVARPRTPQPTG